jgi:hypothetical protein
MQIEKVYIPRKVRPYLDKTYFRLRLFSESKDQYEYGYGWKLTFGFSPHLFFYRKQWREVKLIILGLRFHYSSN